jgi:hypothetical protein
MPLLTLYALIFLQGAVAFGQVSFFAAMHLSPPEWRKLPMMRRRLSKYSARRLRWSAIYLRVVTVVMALAGLVCLGLAGFYTNASAMAVNPRPALPAEVSGIMQSVSYILAGQGFIIAVSFLQWWRSRRALRAMAREELAAPNAANAAGEASAPTGS